MSTPLIVIIAVLVFGFLIFIHEFGHFIFARIFKVKINEFSIGMGPSLLWYDSKKTGIRYKLAMLPIGGYVAMAGEDDESDDPNSFDKKPAWQRFIITLAGAGVNIIFGFLAMIILTSMINVGNTKIHSFAEGSTSSEALMVGDEILEVEGKRVSIADELAYEIMRYGNEPVDILVLRNGEEVFLPDVKFPTAEESGQVFGQLDFAVTRVEKNFGVVMSYSFNKSCLIVRMCWESIVDLITGRYTLAAVSGPVGISSAIGEAAANGFASLLYIVVVISINLGFMNLLPIPALDGGRLLTVLFEMITKKRLPKRLEGIINSVGLILLLILSFVIMIKDVIGLVI
ncbi:MAG: site-2 protease family protein [Clostridia bacterium]|nr:site-2 protease family protein [Clostridia bacterium]